MTILSVNLNKIAVLRNSRGEHLPSVVGAARTCVAAGAGGITVHPRPDQRHIRPADVDDLRPWLPVELNIEGNPLAAATQVGYPGLLALVERILPAQCTLVPDSDHQITSDHGFDPITDAATLRPIVARLKAAGCRVSLFVDPDVQGLAAAAEFGVDRIEIYTGPYARAFAAGDYGRELARCAAAMERAVAAGLGVNAGHDLNQANLSTFLRALPRVLEVSIGHALIAEAIDDGLAQTVRNYLGIIARSRC